MDELLEWQRRMAFGVFGSLGECRTAPPKDKCESLCTDFVSMADQCEAHLPPSYFCSIRPLQPAHAVQSMAEMTRRELLSRIVVAGSVGVAGIVAIPPAIHSLSPVIRRDGEPMWRPVGGVDEFPAGQVRKVVVEVPREDWARSIREKGVYVWHSDADGLVVFSRDCTDLGCPIEHDPGSNWFFCPCHGGIFSTDGTPKAGPPNRPLDRYASRVRDGVLEIDLRSLSPVT